MKVCTYRMSGSLALLLVFTVSTLMASAVLAAGANEREDLNRETFVTAWELIDKTYWDPEFGDLDWPGIREELLPRALEAENDEQLRSVLREMLDRLGDSHFGILPGSSSAQGESDERDVDSAEDAADCSLETREALMALLEERSEGDGQLGLEVRQVEDRFLVTHIEGDGPAGLAGVETGWQLKEIDGIDPAAIVPCLGSGEAATEQLYLVFQVLASLVQGPPETHAQLRMIDLDGLQHELVLERVVPSDLKTVEFGNLPPQTFRFRTSFLGDPEEGRFGVVRFTPWMLPAAKEFERFAERFPELDGVVIDLRGNPGGVGGLSMGIGGHFVAEKDSLGTMRGRGQDLEFRINPRSVTSDGKRIEIFDGPLAILIDSFTASTSEIFAAGLQDLGRARIFGERSMAAALPAMMDRLPNGDVLMHAVADFLRPSGERVEGQGVVPDEPVPVTVEGLAAGRDQPLEAALAWLAEQAAVQ